MYAPDPQFSWDDAYARERGRVYLTGIQALVRLPLMQRRFDRARGLSTAGLISGYRGSPLGGYDQQLWRARALLDAHDIRFQSGLNEDLAATALWGAQMHRAFGPTTVDGVFGLWYGKGPGVDRSGDAFRNANIHGTARLGGVIACFGDDHAAQSSVFPHQTDGILQSVGMPILEPASVPELLSLGLAGIALSRYCGLWVGLKTPTDVVESAGSFELPDPAPSFVKPAGFPVPAHGLNWDPGIRWPAERAELERRLVEERLPAARAWAAANRLDRIIVSASRARFGILAVGKSFQDLMQALTDLQIGSEELAASGFSIYKVALSWPLATVPALAFADGLEEILVVEEKRGLVETQLKEFLYHLPAGRRPAVSGKTTPEGRPLLRETLDLSTLQVARALVDRFGAALPRLRSGLERLELAAAPVPAADLIARKPFFCAGCPHNRSLRLPEGARAGGGIGCHVMAIAEPELRTSTYCQMGGEGMQWVGAAPFVSTTHLFQNLGDGTYQHSGSLAIRAAVAAKTNVTFKILHNDAVAMTGGQPLEGGFSPIDIARQLRAEGVGPVVIVADDPRRWRSAADLPTGVEVLHRDRLGAVEARLAAHAGVSAIVYEQICATEKRRRRKRGKLPAPDRRLYINERVCEGCGDCSVQSRCIAVEPVETPWGRKRAINQSSCNTDFSCLEGFCPSFADIEGGRRRIPAEGAMRDIEAQLFAELPRPHVPVAAGVYNVFVAGIGGAGVLTLGAMLGVAAHLEGFASTVLDFTGLAQKNGAVVSQVRIGRAEHELAAAQIGPGGIDLLLAADLVVGAGRETLRRLDPDRSACVLNTDVTPTAHGVANPDFALPVEALRHRLAARLDPARCFEFEATQLAEALLGDAVFANSLLLGFAWQRRLVPLQLGSLERAIELNGTAVATNLRALHWGRALAEQPARVRAHAGIGPSLPQEERLDALLERHRRELAAYQDLRYAGRYGSALESLRARFPDTLVREAADNLFRLMACKDEYEVARLYTSGEFDAALARRFEGRPRVSLWLAPPLLARRDRVTGRPRKRRFGPWIFPVLRVLAKLKGLRGTPLDPFGWTAERRMERGLIEKYASDLQRLAARGQDVEPGAAFELVCWPATIRGYGPVKAAAVEAALERRAAAVSRIEVRRPIRTTEIA